MHQLKSDFAPTRQLPKKAPGTALSDTLRTLTAKLDDTERKLKVTEDLLQVAEATIAEAKAREDRRNQQEPAAWRRLSGAQWDYIEHETALLGMKPDIWKPLYPEASAQRKPLTLPELARALVKAGLNPDLPAEELAVARAVEAAHNITELL